MAGFKEDVWAGLAGSPKSLPSKYLYDERGSALFEEITQVPEYYPTRAETGLLREIAPLISARLPTGAALVEFGSGSSAKTTLIMDAAPQLSAYAPVDISPGALLPAAERTAAAYPHLQVIPVIADFTVALELPAALTAGPRVGFFPGSTIGNFGPAEAVHFLAEARVTLGEDSLFIVGFDLVKSPEVLTAAYDDASGVTAAFNLNLLARINRELEGDFALDGFAHRAVWNAQASRMEMHLESAGDQEAHAAGRRFTFLRGERIHTESSHKYAVEGFKELATAAGWRVVSVWTSPPPTAFGIALLDAG